MSAQLVILAAGVGRRFGGLKQLTPVGPSGEAILDYTVFDALREGFAEVVLVIRRETEEAMRAHVEPGLARHAAVRYVFQEVPAGRAKPWGTVDAVLSAAAEIRGPFAVANADDFYGRAAVAALGGFLAGEATEPPTWSMVGFPVAETVPAEGAVSRGIVQVKDGFLEAIEEVLSVRRDCAGIVRDTDDGPRMVRANALASMNLWGFGPEVLPALDERFRRFLADEPAETAECYLPTEIGALVAAGRARVSVLPAQSRWCGVTSQADLESVRTTLAELVAGGAYPERLWAT